MALCDHLRADQDIDLALAKSAKHSFKVAHMAHRIAIDTADSRVWMDSLQLGFETFRPFAESRMIGMSFVSGWLFRALHVS